MNVSINMDMIDTHILSWTTNLLYLEDSYKFEGTARVIAIQDTAESSDFASSKKIVVLDQTIFYPQGGGQPADIGYIKDSVDDAEASIGAIFKVADVRVRDGVVIHIGQFSQGTFSPNQVVSLFVNQERRLLNCRLHSAGHLIDVAVSKLNLQLVPGKGYHFPDSPYVEYEGTVAPDQREKLQHTIEEEVDKLIQTGELVKIDVVERTQIEQLCGFVPDYVPEGKPCRIVTVAGTLGCPCGGTHVKNLQEIGTVKVSKIKVKGNKTRISYTLS